MKKHFLNFVLIAAIIGSMTAACSSKKNVSGNDTTKVDSTKMTSPPPADTSKRKKDTMIKKDTVKRDTTHH